MPWRESRVLDEKMRFVVAALDDEDDRTMTELCRVYGVSRKTGYKLLRRFKAEGVAGLEERSRAPHSQPNATAPEIEDLLVAARNRHPRWGPRKLIAWLLRKDPELCLPAASTVGDILKRQGLVKPRKRRRRAPPSERPFASAKRPNDVWCADFKGWFRTGDGRRCDPLTLSDACSRYLLRCDALARPNTAHVRPCFEHAFRQYGLPAVIRTDNGTPFACTAVGGLTRLSAWWVTLGIRPERIEPGKPQQNGRHERIHLTLKGETASPPRKTFRAQQMAFSRFLREYNEERPHEALGNLSPTDLYVPSHRPYPRRPPELVYPEHFVCRMMRTDGAFKWGGEYIYLSEALVGHRVGFEQVSDRIWKVFFGPVYLARFDSHTRTVIRDRRPRRKRKARCASARGRQGEHHDES